jgi:hypothetical protein
VNPRSGDNKTVSFDLSGPAHAKQKPGKNPYKVVGRKDEAQRVVVRETESLNATQLVRVATRPVTIFAPAESATNRKILAALADDPDPAASLAGIRKLLVGPTRNLHDAMFEEMITILEESDHEVQHALQSLDDRLANTSVVTDNLIAESETIRDHTEKLSSYVRDEFERIDSTSQVKLTEMFLAIDSKIKKIATDVNRQVEDLSAKHAADLKELAASLERKIAELAEKSATANETSASLFESRLAGLKGHPDDDDQRDEASPGPHISLADRLRALRET